MGVAEAVSGNTDASASAQYPARARPPVDTNPGIAKYDTPKLSVVKVAPR